MHDPGGVTISDDLSDKGAIDRSVEALHLQLLYAHRVVMPNPFMFLNHRIRPTHEASHAVPKAANRRTSRPARIAAR